MEGHKYLDIYQRQIRNRRRFRLAVAAHILVITAIFLILISPLYWPLHRIFGFQWGYLWMVLGLIWMLALVYSLLRFILGGRWLLNGVELTVLSNIDRRLSDALESVLLATGSYEKVRIFVIPNPAINAFSLYLLDGSYALFITQGVADRLAAGEREAIIAHEISHMQGGDAIMHTAMLHLVGRNAFYTGMQKALTFEILRGGNAPTTRHISIKQVEKPDPSGRRRGLRWEPPLAVLAVMYVTVAGFTILAIAGGGDITAALISLAVYISFVLFVFFLAFPRMMYALFQVFLDRERDFSADMSAVYITRNPSVVYSALEVAGGDDPDQFTLPPYLDELVFNPPFYWIQYKLLEREGPPRYVNTTAGHHQPLMMERMKNLRTVFPQVKSDIPRHKYV
jgi:Zn-dependent protease with chaperone function